MGLLVAGHSAEIPLLSNAAFPAAGRAFTRAIFPWPLALRLEEIFRDCKSCNF